MENARNFGKFSTAQHKPKRPSGRPPRDGLPVLKMADQKGQTMKNQKELKEMYLNIINEEVWPNSPKMQDFARKQLAHVVELSDGSIIDFEKPRIQKDFCYGAGMYAVATDEEITDAENMAQLARTSESYFREKNLEDINRQIEELKKAMTGTYEVYTYLHYIGQKSGSKLKAYSYCTFGRNPEYMPGFWSNYRDLKKIEAGDIQTIINGLEEVKKTFEKRINTYLKRYGTTKVNSWTYICD